MERRDKNKQGKKLNGHKFQVNENFKNHYHQKYEKNVVIKQEQDTIKMSTK